MRSHCAGRERGAAATAGSKGKGEEVFSGVDAEQELSDPREGMSWPAGG